MKNVLVPAAVFVVLTAVQGCYRPSLRSYSELRVPPSAGKGASEGNLRATFLGVSTVLFTDGETSLMVDGFFTRGGALHREGRSVRVNPERERIEEGLRRLGVEELSAVLVSHTHIDHVLDAPEVARQTGAVLVGSRSTLNVGRGWGLPDDQLRRIEEGEPMRFGQFTVTFVESEHTDLRNGVDTEEEAEIEGPLAFPARFTDFIEGGTYSIHFAHPQGSALVHGSAGYAEGALEGYRADTVFLGIARLGNAEPEYRSAYLREVVEATGARRVVPVHWDDWTKPLDEPLRPWRTFLSDFYGAMDFLIEERERGRFDELLLLQAWDEIVI